MSILENENVKIYNIGSKTIYVLGTAHVSAQSADDAYELIHEVMPDSVCVELDDQRIESLKNPKKWSDTDIISIVKNKQSAFMLANLILSSYQKRLADQLGVAVGQEMIVSMNAAEEIGAKVVAVDRPIKTTLMRIWRKMNLKDKLKLIFNVVFGFLDDEDIDESDLEELKSQDMLTSAMSELGESFPSLKRYLVDERDEFIARSVLNAPGEKVVAVVGAAHTVGMDRIIKENDSSVDLKELSEVPKPSKSGKIISWSIPVVLIGMVIFTLFKDLSAGLGQIKSWVIINGILSALGTALAGGHILSILTAFIVAPITSLDPILAAGWFAGLVEAYVRKPAVKDFEALSEDLNSIKGLWKNRITRLLLVVVFANLGSTIGTFVGGIDIFSVFKKFL
ncbi:MAG: TraB/GumN family protein [Anaerofustis stercorihominis]|nr:TraB/GumN family protein [Anaerofustis stercorihominis]